MTEVFVLHLTHKHGDDYWAFDTYEKADARMTVWAEEWWENDGPPIEKPADPEEMSRAYWDHQNEHGNEWGAVHTCVLNDTGMLPTEQVQKE